MFPCRGQQSSPFPQPNRSSRPGEDIEGNAVSSSQLSEMSAQPFKQFKFTIKPQLARAEDFLIVHQIILLYTTFLHHGTSSVLLHLLGRVRDTC